MQEQDILARIEANIVATEQKLQAIKSTNQKSWTESEFNLGETLLYCRNNQIFDGKLVAITDTDYVVRNSIGKTLYFRRSDKRERGSNTKKVTLMSKTAYIVGAKAKRKRK